MNFGPFGRPAIVYSILQRKYLTHHQISAIIIVSGEGSELPEGKNFEKKLKKPLTNSPKSDRIKMFREGQKKGEGHSTNQKGKCYEENVL